MWKRLALASLPSIAVAASLLADPETALAQAVKPRFTLILDTSSSMVENTRGTATFGDGSTGWEGCDRDNTGAYRYDDSRLYQAKGAIADTIAAFGSAEFTLARFRGADLGQACTMDAQCTAIAAGTTCVGGFCASTADHYSCQDDGAGNPARSLRPAVVPR